MSVNQKNKFKNNSGKDSFLTNSVNFAQLRNYNIDISNKRYSNSTNKNNLI